MLTACERKDPELPPSLTQFPVLTSSLLLPSTVESALSPPTTLLDFMFKVDTELPFNGRFELEEPFIDDLDNQLYLGQARDKILTYSGWQHAMFRQNILAAQDAGPSVASTSAQGQQPQGQYGQYVQGQQAAQGQHAQVQGHQAQGGGQQQSTPHDASAATEPPFVLPLCSGMSRVSEW